MKEQLIKSKTRTFTDLFRNVESNSLTESEFKTILVSKQCSWKKTLMAVALSN